MCAEGWTTDSPPPGIPSPRSKQLFPEADLNSRACWDKYSNSVPLGRRNLKSTAQGTLGVLEGLCASLMEAWTRRSAAKRRKHCEELDCRLTVSLLSPSPAFCEGACSWIWQQLSSKKKSEELGLNIIKLQSIKFSKQNF